MSPSVLHTWLSVQSDFCKHLLEGRTASSSVDSARVYQNGEASAKHHLECACLGACVSARFVRMADVCLQPVSCMPNNCALLTRAGRCWTCVRRLAELTAAQHASGCICLQDNQSNATHRCQQQFLRLLHLQPPPPHCTWTGLRSGYHWSGCSWLEECQGCIAAAWHRSQLLACRCCPGNLWPPQCAAGCTAGLCSRPVPCTSGTLFLQWPRCLSWRLWM